MPTTTLMPPFDREPFRRSRVRRCPLCEDAVYGNMDNETCEIHGDPYESPHAAEMNFDRIFGSRLDDHVIDPDDCSLCRRIANLAAKKTGGRD